MPAGTVKWANSSVQDNGLNQIKNNATKMHLISTYTAGDSYATVNTNTIPGCSVTMTGTDFTLSGSAGAPRVLTVASGKTATASGTVTPAASHIAFTDGTANVFWVTPETSGQTITSGNTVNFPSGLTYTSSQPA